MNDWEKFIDDQFSEESVIITIEYGDVTEKIMTSIIGVNVVTTKSEKTSQILLHLCSPMFGFGNWEIAHVKVESRTESDGITAKYQVEIVTDDLDFKDLYPQFWNENNKDSRIPAIMVVHIGKLF